MSAGPGRGVSRMDSDVVAQGNGVVRLEHSAVAVEASGVRQRGEVVLIVGETLRILSQRLPRSDALPGCVTPWPRKRRTLLSGIPNLHNPA